MRVERVLLLFLLMAGCATPTAVGPVTGTKYSTVSVLGVPSPWPMGYYREVQLAEYLKANPRLNQTDTNNILQGNIWIGMPVELAVISIGNPHDINRSVYASGVHEQWVYYCDRSGSLLPCTYLYFENGKLRSWQD